MDERTERLKSAFERNAKAMTLRPSLRQGTARTKVSLRDGLTCDVEDGNWKLTVDASPKSGGDGRGPDPGVFGRAALGSCLAISKPGAHVLDIACGTGLVTFPAARAAGAAGRVVGTDLSQEMVNRATDQARALGLTHVTFQRMDAEALDLEPETFDVALCAL